MLKQIIHCGYKVEEFWDMTLADMKIIIDNYNELERERAKEMIYNQYSIALYTASFMSCAMASKPIPKLAEIAPDMFNENSVVSSENYTNWAFEKLKILSENFNKRFDEKKDLE